MMNLLTDKKGRVNPRKKQKSVILCNKTKVYPSVQQITQLILYLLCLCRRWLQELRIREQILWKKGRMMGPQVKIRIFSINGKFT